MLPEFPPAAIAESDAIERLSAELLLLELLELENRPIYFLAFKIKKPIKATAPKMIKVCVLLPPKVIEPLPACAVAVADESRGEELPPANPPAPPINALAICGFMLLAPRRDRDNQADS